MTNIYPANRALTGHAGLELYCRDSGEAHRTLLARVKPLTQRHPAPRTAAWLVLVLPPGWIVLGGVENTAKPLGDTFCDPDIHLHPSRLFGNELMLE